MDSGLIFPPLDAFFKNAKFSMRGDLLDYRRQHDARSADGKSRSRDEPRKASFLEKFLIYDAPSPYRKPTQVDKRKYAKVNG